jgi:hypothetical protein
LIALRTPRTNINKLRKRHEFSSRERCDLIR